MDVVSGIVSRVRHTAAVYGNRNGVDTDQVATFMIGSRAVEVVMPEAPQIEDGDEVVVAGELVRGKLKARAYLNRSNRTYEGRRHMSYVLGFVVFMIGAMTMLFVGGLFPPALLLVPVYFWIAARGCWSKVQTGRAMRLVRRWNWTPARLTPAEVE